MRKLQDLQLAIVMVRICDINYKEQGNLLRSLLCKEIFGTEVTDINEFDDSFKANRYVSLVFSYIIRMHLMTKLPFQ